MGLFEPRFEETPLVQRLLPLPPAAFVRTVAGSTATQESVTRHPVTCKTESNSSFDTFHYLADISPNASAYGAILFH